MRLVVISALVFFVACVSVPVKPAMNKCEVLLDAVCGHVDRCGGAPTEVCFNALHGDCDRPDLVGDVSDCAADIKAMPCSTKGIPVSCRPFAGPDVQYDQSL